MNYLLVDLYGCRPPIYVLVGSREYFIIVFV